MPPIIPVVEPGRNETDIGALYPSSTQARLVGQRPMRTVSSSKPADDAYRQLRTLAAVRPTTRSCDRTGRSCRH
jgi:hypothetical protein